MRHTIISLLAIVIGCILSSCAKSEWELVWSDEFDGTELDTAYWNVEDNSRGGGNAELQYYSPNNVSIERHPVSGENCLVLSARREDYRNRPCTSARLNTQDKMTVCYGKIEARIAFPHTADGLWPAFWMLGNNLATNLGDNDDVDRQAAQLAKEGRVVWPKCGEIDICEMGHHTGIENGTQDRYFNGAAHWGESFNNGAYPNVGGFYTADYPVQGDFHLFTLVWTEDSIAMYLDSITQPYFHPDMPAEEKYPLLITADDPSFQRVTALPADGTPVKMYVDYIRVYKQRNNK